MGCGFSEEQAEAAFLRTSMKEGRVTLVCERSVGIFPELSGQGYWCFAGMCWDNWR